MQSDEILSQNVVYYCLKMWNNVFCFTYSLKKNNNRQYTVFRINRIQSAVAQRTLPLCSGMGLMIPCWPWVPVEPLPSTWLVIIGGVWGRRNSGDILLRLFRAVPEFRSPVLLRFLFCGPVTNSSASSIIIPCGWKRRKSENKPA